MAIVASHFSTTSQIQHAFLTDKAEINNEKLNNVKINNLKTVKEPSVITKEKFRSSVKLILHL